MTLHQQMRARLYAKAGIPPMGDMTLKEIEEKQWSWAFEFFMERRWEAHYNVFGPFPRNFIQLMKNRLTMGAFRYGLSDDPEKKHYACIKSMLERRALYSKTGDLELLVDVANMMLLTYVEGGHPKAHVRTSFEHDIYYYELGGKHQPGAYYTEFGDKSELVDIACKAAVDFVQKKHRKAHFGSVGEASPKATLL